MKTFRLSYKNKKKVINYDKNLESLENLYKSIKDFTGLEKNEMKISFIDIESEKVDLNDIHDWQYFIGQAIENGSILKIEDVPGLKKKEEKSKLEKEEKVEKSDKRKKLDESEFIIIDNENSEMSENNSRIEKDKEGLMEEFAKAGLINNNEPIIRNSESARIFKIDNSEKKINKECYIAEELKKSFTLLSNDINNSLKTVQKKSKEIIQNVLPKIIDSFDLKKNTDKKNLSKIEICTTHIGFGCKICGVSPIVGKRYKCTVCQKFNLCAKCENVTVHKHPMLRFIEQEN